MNAYNCLFGDDSFCCNRVDSEKNVANTVNVLINAASALTIN